MVSKKSKIIIFCPLNIFPSKWGNQQDIWNRIKIFQEIGYEVLLIQFCEGKNYDVPSVAKDLRIINIEKQKNNKKFVYYKAKGIESEENFKKIIKIIGQEKPEILWFEYFSFAKLAKVIKNKYPELKIYFRSHNYELGHTFEKWIDNLRRCKNISSIFGFLLNALQVIRYENLMFKYSDKVFAISKLGIEKYKKRYKNNNLYYLPFFNNYRFDYKLKPDKDGLDIFYLGGDFKNNVNLSGLEFIYKKIIPSLENNKVFFHILGERYPPEIKNPQIKFHGFVEDLEAFLEDMDVSIVPVEIGYGMKIKVYESLKRGFPTILSKRAHRVFGGQDGEDYFVATNPKEWVDCINLFLDKDLRDKVSKNCKRFMQEEFSKEKIISLLKQL